MFEIHVTTPQAHARAAENLAAELHWKTSEIARDPVSGKATYFYFTTHTTDLTKAFHKMEALRNWCEKLKIPIIREKIEVIIHDVRF